MLMTPIPEWTDLSDVGQHGVSVGAAEVTQALVFPCATFASVGFCMRRNLLLGPHTFLG